VTSNPTAEWIYTFDARNNIPRIGRVLIALGRDAADVPITHTWSDIDAKLVLRHPTSEKPVNLRLAPMVMEELNRLTKLPTNGPMIGSEAMKQPYGSHAFRRQWRILANAMGVPSSVYNMDRRERRTGAPHGGGRRRRRRFHWRSPDG
jgi:hypothetical protein